MTWTIEFWLIGIIAAEVVGIVWLVRLPPLGVCRHCQKPCGLYSYEHKKCAPAKPPNVCPLCKSPVVDQRCKCDPEMYDRAW